MHGMPHNNGGGTTKKNNRRKMKHLQSANRAKTMRLADKKLFFFWIYENDTM